MLILGFIGIAFTAYRRKNGTHRSPDFFRLGVPTHGAGSQNLDEEGPRLAIPSFLVDLRMHGAQFRR